MKDVTLLIAHPDDEALFCWPVLEQVKRIVCASNDAFSPDRSWCSKRGECLHEVGRLLGCEIVCHSNNSEFYRAPTRNGALHLIASDVAAAVRKSLDSAPVLFTHNAWGEYGNLDHILCHHIARTVKAQTRCSVLVSDIAVTESPAWLPIQAWTQGLSCAVPQAGGHRDFLIDRPLFNRIKAIYYAKGCWTWAWEPQETCRVYSL
jgi:LmbE family N-acetylglucosaminyl deacetylase